LAAAASQILGRRRGRPRDRHQLCRPVATICSSSTRSRTFGWDDAKETVTRIRCVRAFKDLNWTLWILFSSFSHIYHVCNAYKLYQHPQECQKDLICFEPEDRKDFAWGCIGEVDGKVSQPLSMLSSWAFKESLSSHLSCLDSYFLIVPFSFYCS
jgi:hypothetical protein